MALARLLVSLNISYFFDEMADRGGAFAELFSQ
jgi:hypothetical protein